MCALQLVFHFLSGVPWKEFGQGNDMTRFAQTQNCSGSYVENGLQGAGVVGEAITVVQVRGDGGLH